MQMACTAAAPRLHVSLPTKRRGRRPVFAALTTQSGASGGTAPKVIVIGAGAGGLATAGRLARCGLDVTVLEKNAEVGGRVQSVTSPEGFRHDTGPSLLLFPDKYREAFAALGTSLEEQGVQLARVAPTAYRVFFQAGPSRPGAPSGPSSLDLLADEAAMAAQLEAEEPGAGEGFRRFLRMARRHLSMGVPIFIDRDVDELASLQTLKDLLPFLPEINLLDLLGRHDWRLQQFFKDPRLRAMFTFQDLYVGLSPYTAPGVFGLLAGTELTDGVWYPMGGFQKVRDGLCRSAQACGVRVEASAEVAAIATSAGPSGPRVTGVVLADGRQLAADLVVCNQDLPAAYSLLDPSGNGSSKVSSSSSLGNSSSSGSSTVGSGNSGSAVDAAAAAYGRQEHERLGRLAYSAGVIAFNWSLNRRLDRLAHHNVFLSGEWQGAWQPATKPDELPSWPNFYVHCPTRTDPSAAPEGCDSVMVLLPVAHMQQMQAGGSSGGSTSGADYGPLVEAGRQRILAAFAAAGVGDDVASAIQHEFVITPTEWERRYGVRHGAVFGLAHGLDQLSVFRPANKDARVEGLYFVGASTRPGNGVPLCLISAKLTAERVLKELGLGSAAKV